MGPDSGGAGEYLKKGSPILVEGRLKLDTWESDGQKRSKLKVIGEPMQMLGGNSRKTTDAEQPALAVANNDHPNDDVPF